MGRPVVVRRRSVPLESPRVGMRAGAAAEYAEGAGEVGALEEFSTSAHTIHINAQLRTQDAQAQTVEKGERQQRQSEVSAGSQEGDSHSTGKAREKNFINCTTLGTGLARSTGTNTGTPREPPKRLHRAASLSLSLVTSRRTPCPSKILPVQVGTLLFSSHPSFRGVFFLLER